MYLHFWIQAGDIGHSCKKVKATPINASLKHLILKKIKQRNFYQIKTG